MIIFKLIIVAIFPIFLMLVYFIGTKFKLIFEIFKIKMEEIKNRKLF